MNLLFSIYKQYTFSNNDFNEQQRTNTASNFLYFFPSIKRRLFVQYYMVSLHTGTCFCPTSCRLRHRRRPVLSSPVYCLHNVKEGFVAARKKDRRCQGVKYVFDIHTSKESKRLEVALLRLWRVNVKTTGGFLCISLGDFHTDKIAP